MGQTLNERVLVAKDKLMSADVAVRLEGVEDLKSILTEAPDLLEANYYLLWNYINDAFWEFLPLSADAILLAEKIKKLTAKTKPLNKDETPELEHKARAWALFSEVVGVNEKNTEKEIKEALKTLETVLKYFNQDFFNNVNRAIKAALKAHEIIELLNEEGNSLYELMLEREATVKFNLKSKIDGFYGFSAYVRVYKDDFYFDGDFDTFQELEQTGQDKVVYGYIFCGDLSVSGGLYQMDGDNGETLVVMGSLKAKNLIQGGGQFYVGKNLEVEQTIYGFYNHGYIRVIGQASAECIFSNDHLFELHGGTSGIVLSSGTVEGAEVDYDYGELQDALIPELLNVEGSPDEDKIINGIMSNKSLLRSNILPWRVKVAQELESLVKNSPNIEILNLSEKKINQIPEIVFTLKNLKNLSLRDNGLQKIDERIGELSNLEVLNISHCQILEIPKAITKLKKLKVLNLEFNQLKQIPDFLNEMESLEKLSVSYNKNIIFPSDLSGMKSLRHFEMANCFDEAITPFPMFICQLQKLVYLNISSNTFDSLPKDLVNISGLQELNLNESLACLNSFPDLSALKSLTKLHMSGSRPSRQFPFASANLIDEVFKISSLEFLAIDRFGESSEVYNENELVELKEVLKRFPEKLKMVEENFIPEADVNPYHGQIYRGIMREALTADQIANIGQLKNLQELDLSFNDLQAFPESIYKLNQLKRIKLDYNTFRLDEITKLIENNPGLKIEGQRIKTLQDPTDENAIAVNNFNKEASKKMQQGDYNEAIKGFEQALKLCAPDKVYSEYSYLFAHYGISYSIQKMNPESNPTLLNYLFSVSKKIMNELVPSNFAIWHYTDLGAFQEECVRIAGNGLGWWMQITTNDEEQLKEALAYTNRAEDFVTSDHYYIYDTKVRILIKLKRNEEAFAIVDRVLRGKPNFSDLQDFLKNSDYLNWQKLNQTA